MSSGERGDSSAKRSSSRTRTSRPTTPLRPSSRSSFRDSARNSVSGDAPFPLNTFEPAFAELSDAVADLEANMMHFQLMHESLSRFNESFASFLYGLNMNAFCVDFPEGPVSESFKRARLLAQDDQGGNFRDKPLSETLDGETTFMWVACRAGSAFGSISPVLTRNLGRQTPPSLIIPQLLRNPHPSSTHQRQRRPVSRRLPIPEAAFGEVVGELEEGHGLVGWLNQGAGAEFDEFRRAAHSTGI